MTDENKVLVTEPAPGVRQITLNNPRSLNAIDLVMADQIAGVLDAAASDPLLRCLVIAGAGERAFSAGFDIREMNGLDAAQMCDAFKRRDPLFLKIAQHPLPVIAALNGLAHGAGALIAASADFRIACLASTFKVTAIGYGSANATWSLPRIVGPARAKDILMSGREVDAQEGMRIGLFDRLALSGNAVQEAVSFASIIAARPVSAVRAVKSLVDRSVELSLEEGWSEEHRHVLTSLEQQQKTGSEIFAHLKDKPS